jgi:Na+/melibiose symporter-like transporter
MRTPAASALILYGFLALPLAFAGMPVYLHAPDFYATAYGQSLTTLGVALLLLRVFDAVQDPVLGALSDRYAHRRALIMLIGMGGLGGGFYMLFHPHPTHTLAWFCAAVALATTAFSLLGINLGALGSLWTTDPAAKTRITTSREAFTLVGLLLAAITPAILSQNMPVTEAYHTLTLLMLACLAVGGLLFLRWLAATPLPRPAPTPVSLRLFGALLRGHGRFYATYMVSSLASAIPAVLVLFFIRDRLEAEAYTGVFLMLYFLAGVAGMPLWSAIAKRKGKYRTWMLAMLLAVVAFVWALFLQAGDIWMYGLICVVSGLALGAELALPPSILSDRIDTAGEQAVSASHFALLALLAKLVLALASGIALPLLGWVGFTPAAANTMPVLLALSVAYAGLPCLIKLGAVALIYKNLEPEVR